MLPRQPTHHPVVGRAFQSGVVGQAHRLELGRVLTFPLRVLQVVERRGGPFDGMAHDGKGPAVMMLLVEQFRHVQDAARYQDVGQPTAHQVELMGPLDARIVGRVGVDVPAKGRLAQVQVVVGQIAVIARHPAGLDAFQAGSQYGFEGGTAAPGDLPVQTRVGDAIPSVAKALGDVGKSIEGVFVNVLRFQIEQLSGEPTAHALEAEHGGLGPPQ